MDGDRRGHRVLLWVTAAVADVGLLAAALFLLARDPYGDSCPSEEWAQNLGWKADAITPEGTTVSIGWIGDCDGQRAVMVRF